MEFKLKNETIIRELENIKEDFKNLSLSFIKKSNSLNIKDTFSQTDEVKKPQIKSKSKPKIKVKKEVKLRLYRMLLRNLFQIIIYPNHWKNQQIPRKQIKNQHLLILLDQTKN